MSKSNRWVKLADRLPWVKIEKEYNKRLRNSHCGAGNKPARMVVGALIVKHVENLSDEKTIQAIQENPYMQYLLGLSKFTEKPVFVPELFVLIRKRLDQDFFNRLTLVLLRQKRNEKRNEVPKGTSLSRFRKNRLGGPQKESSHRHRRPRGSFTLATSQLGQDKLADPS